MRLLEATAETQEGHELSINGEELQSAWRWRQDTPDQLWLTLDLLESKLGMQRRGNSSDGLTLQWFSSELTVPSHALLQLDALAEDPCRTLITTLLLFSLGSRATGQCRNEGEIGFTAAAEGRGLGRLQPLARHHKSLVGRP